MYIHPSPCSKRKPPILAFHANSALSYGRASRAIVSAAALSLAATPASRGGPAPPVGPGLARLVRLDHAGFHGAGVQLRRYHNRSRSASFLRQVSPLTAPTPIAVVSRSHARLPEIVPILYNISSHISSAGLPALAKGAWNCFVVVLDIATPFLPAVWAVFPARTPPLPPS